MPFCRPPYSNGRDHAEDISILTAAYRVSVSSIRNLVPEFLQLADEPLITSRLIRYGKSSVGPYSEFVQQVEVSYQGEVFDFNLILILDNEKAIFLGREKYGFPKVFGDIDLQSPNKDQSVSGIAETMDKKSRIEFRFIPAGPQDCQAPKSTKRMLNLRYIPSPLHGEPPSLRELIPVTMAMKFPGIRAGKCDITFSKSSPIDPWTQLRIIKHEYAFYGEGGKAELEAREKSSL
ncbi:decarboxylase DEC1 [Verticillium alfalfae VaMs.102]|uniref:Decarboxylase DEC1 n=1 Tax=Verticillium alfalfae (strain VaMs.102 / ATCC MYA-4576 / FGSC 10136) TaxID=526221 RepID=C9SYL7_VERA1|nr:decarboxylase DEC1 [Verticillium alfalfae VaMs.102]EEY23882.1 decarboxylase DEC1 [Verticillium alfalfae VaMs.102]